uniref:Uncharacterized protein n=2 Tax=Candidatus Bipolaricaulota TaxID=67810 RepID=H5S8I8_9BACT|nr:hypothetical protein HGMM_F01E02C17 [uncultured Acetothermia bacterium]BAL59606.1 hypothetical protein HGMM_OP4C242 [Candidatus Acetothermum autotrophicum]
MNKAVEEEHEHQAQSNRDKRDGAAALVAQEIARGELHEDPHDLIDAPIYSEGTDDVLLKTALENQEQATFE